MTVTGDTQLGATKQEIISEIAQRALIENSKLLGTVRDVSQFARKGAESISFPQFSSLFSVENRASGVAATEQTSAFGKVNLLLDQRATILWTIDSMDEIESTLDVQAEYIRQATARHAEDVDVKLIAEMEAAGITTTTAGSVSQDIVLEMRRVLLQNKARPNALSLAVSPEDEAALLKIDPFVSADKYGQAIIPNGVLGTIYGVKVVMSSSLAGGQYFMYEDSGLAIGFQRQPQFDEQKEIDYGANSMKQVLDQKYGLKAMQLGAPNAFQADGSTPLAGTESALIVKDNNA